MLVLTAATSFGSGKSQTWRSRRSFNQASMTRQEPRDELKRRGIEYSAKAFIESAKSAGIDLINIFLDAGMDPNTKDDSGRTALMAAASEGNDRAVSLLLARGASVSLTDDEGFTALHWAARALRDFKCVTALLDHGADVHAKAKAGVTPLVWAIPVLPPIGAVQGTFAPDAVEKITALLDHGADINARFGGGLTPLMRAAGMGNVQIIKLLLRRGADVKAVDREGYTARWFALRLGYEDAARILEQAGDATTPTGLLLPVPTHSAEAERRESRDVETAEVMRQVVAAYHSLSTYSDRGTSIDRVNGSNGPYEIRVDFETLFKRPGKLRFAWNWDYDGRAGKKQSVIWCDGATAWSSYSYDDSKPKREEDLGLAVAGAFASSQTTAATIPRLLTDELGGVRLDQLQGLKMMGNETTDGVDCLVVVGYLGPGKERKIWVGRKDHLIRRIEERGQNRTREEVRAQIVVDADIADSRFTEQGR